MYEISEANSDIQLINGSYKLSDKVNYVLSSVSFLENRLAKSIIGLSELEGTIEGVEKIGEVSLDKKRIPSFS